jgi:uncharacterized protein (DUF885 family)
MRLSSAFTGTVLLLAFSPTLGLTGCAERAERNETESGAMASGVTRLADRYVEAWFEAFPHQATLAGVAAGPHDRLPDITAAARARWESIEDAILADLTAIETTSLAESSAEAVTHGFLVELIRNAQAFRVCRMPLWNVSPTWTGWQSELALLANSQPIGMPEQNETAWRRFSELPRYIDQEIENLREGLRLGYSAPRHNVQAVVRQMDALVAAPVAESPFVVMAGDSQPELGARMERLETEQIRPAIQRYRDFLRETYLPAAREAVAVAANPDGGSCYRAAIRYYSTVDITPQAVHQTGLDEMARIRQQMSTIARRSFGTDDVEVVLRRLREDSRYLFSSREAMLKTAVDAVDRARMAVPQWFGMVPQAEVAVEPVPAFQEASAPGGFYNNPAEDGSRPGIYYINLHEAESKPRAGLEATAFHETYPGHHLQGAIALERQELHPVQRYMFLSGFGEGWALYSEQLAEEMSLYTSDVDRIGLLSNEALRAARLVVDPGMHALGWSREQAIDYMLANTAESRSSVEAEVDRYIAVPGQATSYMLGSLEILRLRDEARAALGDRFDIKAFHDRVLEDGSVPLVMLRHKIERWLREAREGIR